MIRLDNYIYSFKTIKKYLRDNYIYSFKTIKKYLSRVLIRGMKSFKKNLTIFKKIFMFLFLTNDKRRVIKGN